MEKIPAKPVLGEIAAIGGDDIGAEFVGELRDAADEVLRVRGGGDLQVYERVYRDGQVRATFQQRRASVVSREWHVEPGGDRPIDKEAADDLRSQLMNIGWDRVTRKMLFGVFLGYSIGECIFHAEESRIRLDAIKVRKARRFRFDKDGKLRLITKREPQGRVMPDAKFWIFAAGADDDDDPHGLALAYWLYWPVWFKRNTLRFYANFLERFAQPTPVAKVPPGTTEPERQGFLRLLRSVIGGGRLVIPNNIMVDLLEAAKNSGGDYLEFIKYLDRDIAKITLSQTMTTDDGSSQAQAVVHNDVKLEVTKEDADLCCESFNDQVATWLTHWNFPGAAVPRVWRDVADPEDLVARAQRDKAIGELGFHPTEQYILDTYGPGFVRRPSAETSADFAEHAPDVVSRATQEIVDNDGWRELVGTEVESIEQLVANARTLEEVRDRLGEIAQRNPDAVVDSLARAMFAAHVAGQVDEELDADDD
jgi:phage gp29-like protein